MKMKRKSTAVLVAALVAACGLWFALRPSKQTGITLETAATSRITIRNSVTATGTVEPVTEVEVGTQVSGIIDRLYVDYNDVVKAGQLIAEMDKVTLQAELESSQAELASCKTEYEYRMKEYSRTRTLHEKELVSDAEYDEALYLYEKARNAYEQAQAAIVKVKRNLGYATITSPIDGVVISRAVEEGQTVAAGRRVQGFLGVGRGVGRQGRGGPKQRGAQKLRRALGTDIDAEIKQGRGSASGYRRHAKSIAAVCIGSHTELVGRRERFESPSGRRGRPFFSPNKSSSTQAAQASGSVRVVSTSICRGRGMWMRRA